MGCSLPSQEQPCSGSWTLFLWPPGADWLDKEQILRCGGETGSLGGGVCMRAWCWGGGWNWEDTKGLAVCIHKANPSHSDLFQLACPEQSRRTKALHIDAENTARSLMAAITYCRERGVRERLKPRACEEQDRWDFASLITQSEIVTANIRLLGRMLLFCCIL